jgi:predicted enzyme related to lactoylglutathione lyase
MAFETESMRAQPMLAKVLVAALLPLCTVGHASPSRHMPQSPDWAVGPQYDSTHVYVLPEDFDGLVASLIATFGGTASKQGSFTVTPTPSEALSQLVLTPVGTISVFGFKTPIPYPFGSERSGYLVRDLESAVQAARAQGADVIVAPFVDSIGRDAVIQWPGGVNMQLYWHAATPEYASLVAIPENRVYISADRVGSFLRSFTHFARGRIVADDGKAPGVEIGRPGVAFRSVRVESHFGRMEVLVTDGHLPFPYGREVTGYEVKELTSTLEKARAAGATVLVEPFQSRGRGSAMVQFPGGYIAEIHAIATR